MRLMFTCLVCLVLFPILTAKAQPGIIDTLFYQNFDQPLDSSDFYFSPGGNWQVGSPQKTNLNAPHSAPHVLITDTINPVAGNQLSYVDIRFPDSVYVDSAMAQNYCGFSVGYYPLHQILTSCMYYGFCVEFKHRTFSDNAFGKGYFELAFQDTSNLYLDYGLNEPSRYLLPQFGLGVDSAFEYMGYRGLSTDWTTSRLCWGLLAVLPPMPEALMDTFYLRFYYESDTGNYTNMEGWMIDDVLIYLDNLTFIGDVETHANEAWTLQSNPEGWNISPKAGEPVWGNLEVWNISGQLMQRYPYLSGNPVAARNYPPGMYFLRFYPDGEKNPIVFKVKI